MTPCILATGKPHASGYGKAYYLGRHWMAHRLAAHLAHGPCPPGMVVRHKCDVKLCVNPDHLEYGTHSQNMLDLLDRQGGVKLTRELARRIRVDPRRVKEIANEYGIKSCTVSNIKANRIWKEKQA